jgi:hypothetical protein
VPACSPYLLLHAGNNAMMNRKQMSSHAMPCAPPPVQHYPASFSICSLHASPAAAPLTGACNSLCAGGRAWLPGPPAGRSGQHPWHPCRTGMHGSL